MNLSLEAIMKNLSFALFAFIFLCLIFSTEVNAQKIKAEEVIAKHLDSIGTAEARSSVKSQMLVGDAKVTFLSQKNQSAQGRIVLASAGEKNFLGMNLNAVDYPSEKFSFDGKKAKVGYVRSGIRSILGNFVISNNQLLEESLLGGTLSTSWALLNLTAKKGKITSEGIRKIDGKEVYALRYLPRTSDVKITLYFNKDTFRHIRTEYSRVSSAGIGTTPEESSRMSETRIKVVEEFSNFKDEKGLMLPHGYRILYSTTGQNGTTEIEWAFNFTEFSFNQTFDEKTFNAEAN
jgi:hypothetical protein